MLSARCPDRRCFRRHVTNHATTQTVGALVKERAVAKGEGRIARQAVTTDNPSVAATEPQIDRGHAGTARINILGDEFDVRIDRGGFEQHAAGSAAGIIHVDRFAVDRPGLGVNRHLGHQFRQRFGREILSGFAVGNRTDEEVADDVGVRFVHRCDEFAEHLSHEVAAAIAGLAGLVPLDHREVLGFLRLCGKRTDHRGQPMASSTLDIQFVLGG